jgi:hypothetical protein
LTGGGKVEVELGVTEAGVTESAVELVTRMLLVEEVSADDETAATLLVEVTTAALLAEAVIAVVVMTVVVTALVLAGMEVVTVDKTVTEAEVIGRPPGRSFMHKSAFYLLYEFFLVRNSLLPKL